MPLKAVANTGGGGVAGSTIMGTFYYATPTNTTIPLVSYAEYAFTINGLNNLVVSGGTITAEIQINGTPVTGLAALAVTGVAQNPTATAANVVNVGDQVTVVLSSNASSSGLQFTMRATRN